MPDALWHSGTVAPGVIGRIGIRISIRVRTDIISAMGRVFGAPRLGGGCPRGFCAFGLLSVSWQVGVGHCGGVRGRAVDEAL